MYSAIALNISVYVESEVAIQASTIIECLRRDGHEVQSISDHCGDTKSDLALLFLGRVPDMPQSPLTKSVAEDLFDSWSATGTPTVIFFPDPGTGLSAEAWQAVQENIAAVDQQNAFLARLKNDNRCAVFYYPDADNLSAVMKETIGHLEQLAETQVALADDQTFIASPPRLHTP
jgi:hypothetical protein